MIEVHERLIAGIPLLEVVDSEQANQKLPTVIFYHGWTNVKERVLVHGYVLAKQGFRTLLPEALYHGGRSDGRKLNDHLADFWSIVHQSVEEYPELITHYIDLGLTDAKRVGVTGLSMGGITTCALVATYDSIKAADCLMGSPTFKEFSLEMIAQAKEMGYSVPEDLDAQFEKLATIDLGQQPEKIAGRPVHFWHGTNDNAVPYQPTYDFYQKVKEKDYGQRVTFTTTADEHRVPYVISQETAAFFKKHL